MTGTRKRNWVTLTATHGFYYFGEEIQGDEGYITLIDGAMAQGYEGSWPSVTRGDSVVKLARFAPGAKLIFPLSNVIAIHEAADLYASKNTKLG